MIAIFIFVMATIKQTAAELRRRIRNMEKDLLAIIKLNEQEILDMVRAQMMNGINADGESIGEYKSENYAIMKELYNPRGVVDLRLTGSFHALMYLDCSKFPIMVRSEDEKEQMLIDSYGNILGLTEKNKKLLPTPNLKKAFENYYKKFLSV